MGRRTGSPGRRSTGARSATRTAGASTVSRALAAAWTAWLLGAGACGTHTVELDGSVPDGSVPDGAVIDPVPEFPWIDKTAFEGQWWYGATVEEVTGELPEGLGVATLTAPFVGARSVVGGEHTLGRVRFEIQEDLLVVMPVDGDEPVAAFRIEAHRDLDDGTERPWYERRHVRVDWSQQLVPTEGIVGASVATSDRLIGFEREPIAWLVGDDDRPPAFESVSQETDRARRAEWGDDAGGLLSTFSTSGRELWRPEACPGCDDLVVQWRYAFLRVPPGHQYASARYTAVAQERFGALHVAYDDEVSLRARRHTGRGGLDGRACAIDANCGPGSECDLPARTCQVPLRDRPRAPITWELDADYPPYLVRGAFAAVADWNEAFMRAARALEGRAPPGAAAPVPCQSDDPAAWCFCGPDAIAPEVNATNACRANPSLFVPPAARGQADPYDCWIEGPDDLSRPASPDAYGPGDAALRFEGPECALVLRFGDRPLGDLRESRIGFVPGARFCGVAQPRLDPATGEIVTAPLHLGGGCLEELGELTRTLWPTLRGDPGATLRGDPALDGYLERAARAADVTAVVPPRPPSPIPIGLVDPARPRIPALPEPPPMDTAPLLAASGSAIERALVTPIFPEAARALHRDDPLHARRLGLDPDAAPTDAGVAEVSPFGAGPLRALVERDHRDRLLVQHAIFGPRLAHFAAGPQRWWARAYEGRADAEVRWRQVLHRAMVTRLLGHGLGLTANLAASLDRDHYPDAHFQAGLTRPLPRLDTLFVSDSAAEARWRAELEQVRAERLARGLGNASSASVLDVHGDLSDLAGVGRYDRAAIFFHYFDRVEVLDANVTEQVVEPGPTTNDRWLRSDRYSRSLWRFYTGGEACSVDTECPHGPGSPTLAPGQRTHQRCLQAEAAVPSPCGGEADCVCSDHREDVIDYLEGAAPAEWYGATGFAEHQPIEYLVCAPSDAGSALCAIDDAGASHVETVAHMRAAWRELYPFAYAEPRIESPTGRYGLAALRLMHHLFDRYFNEPDFRRRVGPLGFNDHYWGMLHAYTWLAELATLPDAGGYAFDAAAGSHRWASPDAADPIVELALPVGLGFAHASTVAGGEVTRYGVAWDRHLALLALTQPTLGYDNGGTDLAIAFGDLLLREDRELLGGLAADIDTYAGPFAAEAESAPAVLYPFRTVDSCRDMTTGDFEWCRAPGELSLGLTPIETASPTTRLWAGARALIALEGRTPIVDAAGAPPFPISGACGLGEGLPGGSDPVCADEADAAYAVYRARDGRAWVASRHSAAENVRAEYPTVGYSLLRQAIRRAARLAQLEALPAPTPAELAERTHLARVLTQDEARIAELADVARAAGITDWRPATM